MNDDSQTPTEYPVLTEDAIAWLDGLEPDVDVRRLLSFDPHPKGGAHGQS